MIRRIVESLRTRSFSMFATELIIVIVGVFMGLQVSNWNDERLDRIRADSYLERIRNDLDADIINFRDRLRFWDEVTGYGVRALTYANTGDKQGYSDWELLLAYFQASQMGEFLTTRATYDELKSSGELGLIRDLELRKSLASYYTSADNPVLSERPAYREHVRGLIPLHMQSYIWSDCYTIQGEFQVFNDCEAPKAEVDLAEILQAISTNTKLSSELRYWMSTMQVAAIMGNNRTKRAVQLRKLLSEKIESGTLKE